MRHDQVYWMGKPLAELSREELIDAVMLLQEQFDRSRDNFIELAKLNQKLLARAAAH